MIEDRGPWNVIDWRSTVAVMSEDFTHDVILEINGDFANLEQKRKYAEGIAHQMNALNDHKVGSRKLLRKDPSK